MHRFRMRKSLFLDMVHKITEKNSYFLQRANASGHKGFHPIHKCLVAMRMLSYGSPADSFDDTYRMAESTVLETVKQFVRTIISVYESEHLRPPTTSELETILQVNEARGFPGMIGSIDCMHWEWSNCPTSWQGQYRGRKGKPTIILEAVATQDLHIWHAFFGLPGSHNDINVLHRSPIFDDLAAGQRPQTEFHVNGTKYNMGYYLADGIYPDWATLVKTYSEPVSLKERIYAQTQESARKDVERAFGVLRSKFRIIYNPARLWSQSDLNNIMHACVILHNMVIEDEINLYSDHHEFERSSDPPISQNRDVPEISQLITSYTKIRDKVVSNRLQKDLMEHIWHLYGNNAGPFANRQGR
jgi:hypothetical protein